MSGTVKKRFSIALDIADSGANREFTVVEGDSGNQLSILLTDGGDPVDLTGCRVVAVFSRSDGTSCQDRGAEDGGAEKKEMEHGAHKAADAVTLLCTHIAGDQHLTGVGIAHGDEGQ